jgi:glycosyltransferase involved in cell wall biosynthesis
MKIAAFTGSPTISSRRFRVLQYIDGLAARGIDIDEFVARRGSWPPRQRWKRPFWLLAALIERVGPTIASRRYDAVLLQREMISTLHTLERFAGRPRILDVDDAVWLTSRRARRSFAALARSCDGVICGNDYIAGVVGAWNSNTIVVPTAVDTRRFHPAAPSAPRQRRIIGWSGLHAGSKYLLGIEEPLARLLSERPDTILRVVSDAPPDFRHLPADRVEFIRWSPDNEVRTIQEMDIGLMPIEDSEWSKGKCSYKMLLYMACGVPVAVSPFGMNVEVLARGAAGIGPRTPEEWYAKLGLLLDDEPARKAMGAIGRSIVEDHYSLDVVLPRLAGFLESFDRHHMSVNAKG